MRAHEIINVLFLHCKNKEAISTSVSVSISFITDYHQIVQILVHVLIPLRSASAGLLACGDSAAARRVEEKRDGGDEEMI